MAISSDDPEISAAFSGAPPPVLADHESDDPEIAAAYKPDTESELAKATRRGHEESDAAKLAHEYADSMYHGAVGGLKGLGTLATTFDFDKAADTVNSETAKGYKAPPSSLKSAMESDYNPINWPRSIAQTASDTRHLTDPETGIDLGPSKPVSPLAATAMESLPAAIPAFTETGALFRGKPALPSAQSVANEAAARQSGGAAGTGADLSETSQPIKDVIAATKPEEINVKAMENHREADAHGVELTKGQATQDPAQWSGEHNSTDPKLVERFNTQETQLVNAIDNVRRDASPTNVANSPRENGQVVIDELKAYDEPIKAKVSATYGEAEAMQKAAGKGALQLDAKPAVEHAAEVLEDREDLLPGEARPILDKLRQAADSGTGIPLKQAETWKTIVARASRKYERAGDGNATQALSDFRDSLEQLAPSNASAPVLAKFNEARALARDRFSKMDDDPAYKAAANDDKKRGEPSNLADTFLDDYALNRSAPKAQVDLMAQKLGEEGKGALASHALSAIRKGAVNASGKVRPEGYNAAVAKYQDKLDSLVSPETLDKLESLGRVITNAKVEPPGGSTNWSKSGVISNAAHAAAGHLPIVKHLAPFAKSYLDANFAKEAVKPGAGINSAE